jgi:hypothetical protein
MTVLLGKMARPTFALCLLQEGELRDAIAADVFSGSGRYGVIAIGTYETPT